MQKDNRPACSAKADRRFGPVRSDDLIGPCWMASLDLPLPGNGREWKIHRIFRGSSASVKRISAHMSMLSSGSSPHPPHAHEEEELLMLLSGEADIVTPDNRSLTSAAERIVAGSVVYHAASRKHTIRSTGPDPATYLIFKWRGSSRRQSETILPSTVFHRAGVIDEMVSQSAGQMARRVIFESPTLYLRKLRCHVSILQPGDGYPPHIDAYDVAIFTISGAVETLGRKVGPRTMIFYAAGEPHGMRNAGAVPASYLVIEFHGSKLRQKWYTLMRKGVRLVRRRVLPHSADAGQARIPVSTEDDRPEAVCAVIPSMKDLDTNGQDNVPEKHPVNPPFFSVVIPTHNRAEMLREAMRSVLGQSFQAFEMLVVDDYSTDSTREVVRSFNDGRVVYIRNDRGCGGAGTRNAGIFRARGKWVAFLDDDDIWLPEKLAVLHKKIIEGDGSAGLIYTGAVSYDFEKKRELQPRIPEKEGRLDHELLLGNCIGSFSTVAIRTDLLMHVGGLDEDFTALQDRELYTRVARLTSVAFVRTVLSYIRVKNSDRITFAPRKKLESSLRYWKKYSSLIDHDPKLRHRAASRVFLFALRDGDLKEAVKALPWTSAGLVVDTPNASHTLRSVYALYRSKLVQSLKSYSATRKIIFRLKRVRVRQ